MLPNCLNNVFEGLGLLPSNQLIYYRRVDLKTSGTGSTSLGVNGNFYVSVRGETRGVEMSAENFNFSNFVGEIKASNVPLSRKIGLAQVEFAKLPPDEYKGALVFDVKDQDDNIEIPVDIRVKWGAGYAVAAIALGSLRFFLARVYAWAQLSKKYEDLNKVLNKLNTVVGSRWLKELNYEAWQSQADYANQYTHFQRWLKVVKFEATLDQSALQSKTGDLNDIYTKLKKGEIGVRNAKEELKGLTDNVVNHNVTETSGPFARFKMFVMNIPWGNITINLFRNTLTFGLFVYLLYLGITTQYINNLTWGVNGVQDFLALVAWAFGSEVLATDLNKWLAEKLSFAPVTDS